MLADSGGMFSRFIDGQYNVSEDVNKASIRGQWVGRGGS